MKIRILSILIALTSVYCASVPLDKKAEKAVVGLNENDQLLENSNLTPEQKTTGKKNNEQARTVIKEQGKENAELKVENKRLEWYEDIVWEAGFTLGGILIGAGIIFWLKK